MCLTITKIKFNNHVLIAAVNEYIIAVQTFHTADTEVTVQVSVNAFCIVLEPPVFNYFFFGFN